MARLNYCEIYRTEREMKLMKSIHTNLKKGKYILLVTDKSGISHLGYVKDYKQKAEAYQAKNWSLY